MSSTYDDGFASAQDTARFFGYQAPTEDEYRRIRAERDAEAQDGAVTQVTANASAKAASTVVLARGQDEVHLAEEVYVEMLAEHGLTPPANGHNSTLAVQWLSQSAEKRGLASLAKSLAHLQSVGQGLIFARRSDGSVFTPKPVTTVKVAQVSEEDDQATAATTDLSDEVAEYLGAAAEADNAPPVRAGRVVGRRRLRPLVRVDAGGPAAPEGT